MEQSRATRGKLVGFLFVLALAFGLLLGTSTPAWAEMAEPTESSVTLTKEDYDDGESWAKEYPITLDNIGVSGTFSNPDLRIMRAPSTMTAGGKFITKVELNRGTDPGDFKPENLSFGSGNVSINAAGDKITVTGINKTSFSFHTVNVYNLYCSSIVVYYRDPIKVTEVSLNKSTVDLTRGGSETLTADVEPDNADFPTVTWSSSNSKVATVDNEGNIAAAGVGTATITATAANGTSDTGDDKTATCTVTVTYTPEDVMAMINDLPAAANVKTSDDAAIKAARAAFNSLSDANKAKVTNVNKLEAAEAALPKAYFAEHKAAQKAEADKKAKTGDSDEVKALIAAAKNDIDNLAYDESKTLDQNKAAVTAIVTKLTTDIADQRAADTVIAQIAALPSAENVTADNKAAIENARKAYDKLTDSRKAKVPAATLKKLTDAEAALKEAIDTAAAQAVIDKIAALPSAENVTAGNKAAIEEVRAAYDALTKDQQAKVPTGTLKRLTDAEAAVAAAVVLDKIDALPNARNVTTENEQAIEAARTAYDALNDEQKAWISNADLKKLTDAVDALAAAKVTAMIDPLPEAGAVKIDDKAAIEASSAEYGKLTDEQKAWVTETTLEKLTTAKAELKEVVDTAAANDAIAKITALPAEEGVTPGNENDIVLAREAYDGLTDDQKAKVPAEVLQRLTTAEDALPVVQALAVINALPTTDGVSADNKDAIEAARAAYNKLTDEQRAKVPAYTLKKLTDAEEALPIAIAMRKFEYLTIGVGQDETLTTDEETIKAAREAYDALTDEQRAKVPADALNTLLAAEIGLIKDDITPSGVDVLIAALPEADRVTTSHRDEIAAARAAYNALTEEQKQNISQETLKKLIDAEDALAGVNETAATPVITQIDNLPATDNMSGSTENKTAIEEARAAYDALTPDQKDKVDPTALEKLTAAESSWVTAYKSAQKTEAGTQGEQGDSQAAQALITAAQTAIDAIPYSSGQSLDEYQAAVDAIITKLRTDLDNQRAADTVGTQITTVVPDATDVATDSKGAITAARVAYDALTPDQKKKVSPETLQKLTAAEAAWTNAYKETQKDAAGGLAATGDSAAAEKLIADAKAAIEAKTFDPGTSLDERQAAVDAIIAQLRTDLDNQREADTVSTQIDALPKAGKVTTADRGTIEAARQAYEALTDAQKEVLNNDPSVLEYLLAAEAALSVAQVNEQIANLPSADQIKTTNKDAIEEARASYEALDEEQKAKVPASVLKKLTDAEQALPIAAATGPISDLPNPGKVTTGDQGTIEEARAAYDALTPEQKADVPEATIKKLAEAEAALKKAKGELTPEYVIGLINALPEPASVKPSDRDAIVAARAAYEALDAEKKAAVTNSDELQLAETALGNANNSAASIVESQVNTIPELESITTANKEAIEQARKDYDALTADQKAKLPGDILQKLEAAEAKLKEAVDTEAANGAETQINGLPTDNVTPDKAADIEAARTAYDALTPDQKAKLPAGTLEKLEAAEAALKDAVDTAAADTAGTQIANLPSASKVTPNSEEDIKAAREAYDKLTDDQKAKLPEGTLEKLEAAEAALPAAKSKAQIASLPATDQITPADKDAIENARKAYDALTDEQKARIPAGTLAKLEAAEAALVEATGQAAADDASGKVSALPATDKVTASDKAAIEAARKAYDALTPEQKAKLPADTLKKLEAAEAALKDAETAKAASDKVAALPAADKVTASDKAAIEAARKAYDALTPEQKAKLPADTLKKLEAAEKALAEAEKALAEAEKAAATISIATAKVTLAKTSMTYTGKTLKPAVKSVILNGKTLKAGTDYTVKYTNNKKIGTATVTLTGKGSYEGSAKATFKIVLGRVKAKTAMNYKAKTVTVKWKKVTGAKSYQVQWRANNGKWKTKTVKSAKAAKAIFKGMKVGKFYDFRVRAVAGKQKSAWSAVKYCWFAKQTGVKASSKKAGTLKVTWKQTVGATAGYKVIVRYAEDNSKAAIQAVAAGKTSVTIKGLKAGKQVKVFVRPLRKVGDTVIAGIMARAKSLVKIAGKTSATARTQAVLTTVAP